jgi:hypothetical protein
MVWIESRKRSLAKRSPTTTSYLTLDEFNSWLLRLRVTAVAKKNQGRAPRHERERLAAELDAIARVIRSAAPTPNASMSPRPAIAGVPVITGSSTTSCFPSGLIVVTDIRRRTSTTYRQRR